MNFDIYRGVCADYQQQQSVEMAHIAAAAQIFPLLPGDATSNRICNLPNLSTQSNETPNRIQDLLGR